MTDEAATPASTPATEPASTPEPTPAPTPELTTIEPLVVAVMRETVPMTDMTSYFERAFPTVASALGQQGIAITGPPLAVYDGTPTDTANVAGGFPSATKVTPVDGVSALTLPGGRAVTVVHRGPYDSMGATYEVLVAWMREQGLTPSGTMWESYLTEPTPGGDPDGLLTEIVWPVAG